MGLKSSSGLGAARGPFVGQGGVGGNGRHGRRSKGVSSPSGIRAPRYPPVLTPAPASASCPGSRTSVGPSRRRRRASTSRVTGRRGPRGTARRWRARWTAAAVAKFGVPRRRNIRRVQRRVQWNQSVNQVGFK